MLLLLTVFAVTAELANFLLQNRRFISLSLRIPSPTSVPIIGDLLLLHRYNFSRMKRRLLYSPQRIVLYVDVQGQEDVKLRLSTIHYHQDHQPNIVKALDLVNKPYGDCYKLWARVPLVFISRPEDMEIVCSNPALQDHGHAFDGLIDILGNDSLLTCRAERSKEVKKMLHKTFTGSSQLIIFENFRKANEDLLQAFKLREGQWINSLRFIKEATSQSIIGGALSADINEYSKLKDAFLDGFDKLTFLVTCRGVSPIHRNDFLFKQVLGGKRLFQLFDCLDKEWDNILKKKQREYLDMVTNNIERPNQYIYNLLREKPRATNKVLGYDARNLVIAALDTSAATAAFALLMLAMHPDIQQLVHEETIAVHDELNGKPLDERSIVKYEFLSRVIKETMRLFPPVPIMPRRVNEDTKFGKYVIPKGASIMASILSLHRDPTVHEKPSVFDPDRFLSENLKKMSKYSYIPFGSGLRSCPGSRYGTQSAIYTVSSIIYNYKVYTKYNSIQEIDENLEVVTSLNIVGGFPLRMERR